jgi:hypothetical protein
MDWQLKLQTLLRCTGRLKVFMTVLASDKPDEAAKRRKKHKNQN